MIIVSITDVIEPRYRQLDVASYNGTSIAVLYEVTSDKVDTEIVSIALDSAVTNGDFTTALNTNLAAAGIDDIQVSAGVNPMVTDVSPTSKPTYRPSKAPIRGTAAPSNLATLELTQVIKDIQTCMICRRFSPYYTVLCDFIT